MANIIPTSHSHNTTKTQTTQYKTANLLSGLPPPLSGLLIYDSSLPLDKRQRRRDHHVLAVNNRSALRLMLYMMNTTEDNETYCLMLEKGPSEFKHFGTVCR